MAARSLLMVGLLSIAFAVAGCLDGDVSNGPEGQSASGDGNLAYNGASAGTQSDDFGCDGSGSVQWSANLGSGRLTVTVTDAGGAQVYSESLSGPGQASRSSSVDGAGGEWTLKATRSSGTYGSFSGQYAINVDC